MSRRQPLLQLAMAIEKFLAKLAARGTLDADQAARLHLLRAELSIIRHIEEGVCAISQRPSIVKTARLCCAIRSTNCWL